VSDIFIPNFQPLTPEVERDLRDSAILDGLFPALLARLPGKARADNFDAIAVYFTSVSGAVRYYPRDGFPSGLSPTPRSRQIVPHWDQRRTPNASHFGRRLTGTLPEAW
jgi:hypothetical protein